MVRIGPFLTKTVVDNDIIFVKAGGVPPTWDGKVLDTHNASDRAWVAHEIAHILTTRHRELPNYGMGDDPGGGGSSERTLSHDECYAEENLALIGGVILLIEDGALDTEVRVHILEYGIYTMDMGVVARAYDNLPALFTGVSFGELERRIVGVREAEQDRWRTAKSLS